MTLWTAGDQSVDLSVHQSGRAGLTVTSVMVALGEPTRVLGLVDPDSDLAEVLGRTGRGVVQLLGWPDRDLAEAFAGTAPAPGGAFRTAPFVETGWGPRLQRATTWAGVALESTRDVGWSLLVTATIEHVEVGEDAEPLLHRRGRWLPVTDRG